MFISKLMGLPYAPRARTRAQARSRRCGEAPHPIFSLHLCVDINRATHTGTFTKELLHAEDEVGWESEVVVRPGTGEQGHFFPFVFLQVDCRTI